ncbi:Paired amphipathic helix [Arabidopsis thaliana x Arabidopsis arenosa]|uniref:Paired amphipathic helix n=1 Tax=Arabidopsis thaliana x Arabidopsis arenosa TaxID=1240361 RepID=A0A8T2C280_9BRAS|nr:Paired amphipathic helix [Arabidopsis thaliana x Arabidopsis arenosa]
MDDATSYLTAVKKAFHDEPAKYVELIKLLNDLSARRVDAASVIARVDELMKDHQNLLLGFSVFLSANMSFIRKLKARYQGVGSHVVDSVLQILRLCRVGNKSKSEAYQEVVELVQGHEDLVMELSEIFSGLTDPSGSTSTSDTQIANDIGRLSLP